MVLLSLRKRALPKPLRRKAHSHRQGDKTLRWQAVTVDLGYQQQTKLDLSVSPRKR